jgi:hypothetical protein
MKIENAGVLPLFRTMMPKKKDCVPEGHTNTSTFKYSSGNRIDGSCTKKDQKAISSDLDKDHVL